MYCPFYAMVFPEICRPGFYCPAGISNYTATPCPSGTYSDEEGLKIASECHNVCLVAYIYILIDYVVFDLIFCDMCVFQCTAGSYCSSTGLTQPEGECSPGYYCAFGAKTSTPTDNLSGGLCGAGHVSFMIYDQNMTCMFYKTLFLMCV
jgi:hypothetical protein